MLLLCFEMSKPMTAGDRGDILSRPLIETPLEELVDLFLANAKQPSDWMIGLELELFLIDRASRRPVEHAELETLLNALGNKRHMTKEREAKGPLVGLRGQGTQVSLEPGGQLEFATKPHFRLKAMHDSLSGYIADLKEIVDSQGIDIWALGYQPFETRETIPRMPKARYDLMRQYFSLFGGPRALDMMHLTCSVQCAVDFSDERSLQEKVRTAALASPFITALVAASPFTEGKPNGFKSLRYQVWLETADDRSGLWPEMVDGEGLTARRYLERALSTRALFFIRGDRYQLAEPKPYLEIAKTGFHGTDVTVADFLDHLTTLFPEVRPKGYVELRGADCLKPDDAVAVAGVWRGLLDYEATCRSVAQRLAPLTYADLRQLQRDVARFGLDAKSPIGSVREIAKWLVDAAHRTLAESTRDCSQCVEPLVERAQRGRSPADDMLEIAEKESIDAAIERCAKL
jgi:glutamate--cysteine ligase